MRTFWNKPRIISLFLILIFAFTCASAYAMEIPPEYSKAQAGKITEQYRRVKEAAERVAEISQKREELSKEVERKNPGERGYAQSTLHDISIDRRNELHMLAKEIFIAHCMLTVPPEKWGSFARWYHKGRETEVDMDIEQYMKTGIHYAAFCSLLAERKRKLEKSITDPYKNPDEISPESGEFLLVDNIMYKESMDFPPIYFDYLLQVDENLVEQELEEWLHKNIHARKEAYEKEKKEREEANRIENDRRRQAERDAESDDEYFIDRFTGAYRCINPGEYEIRLALLSNRFYMNIGPKVLEDKPIIIKRDGDGISIRYQTSPSVEFYYGILSQDRKTLILKNRTMGTANYFVRLVN